MNNELMNCGFRLPAEQVLWQAGISDFGTSTPHSLPSEAEPLRRTGAFPACPAGRRNPQSGISLIEVIMVMVIIAILAAVVIPKAGFDISPRASVEGAAYMIASDIRYVQECAMATRTSKTITFSLGANSYSFALTPNNLDPTGQLPPGVTTTALTLTFNSLGEPIVGGGGSVTLSGGGGTKTINVENYTGKVSIP